MLCATLASGGIGLTTSPPLPAAPVAGSPYPTAPPSKGSWARFLRIPEQWASLPSKHGELFTQVRHNLPWETRVAPPSRATEPTSHPHSPARTLFLPANERCAALRSARRPLRRAAPAGKRLLLFSCVLGRVSCVSTAVNEDPSLTTRRRLKQPTEARSW